MANFLVLEINILATFGFDEAKLVNLDVKTLNSCFFKMDSIGFYKFYAIRFLGDYKYPKLSLEIRP